MKKMVMIGLIVVLTIITATVVYATPKSLPAGTTVSAVCNGDNTATVLVNGVRVEKFDKYHYFKNTESTSGSNRVVLDLNEGRRLNFTFDGGYYAGLSKEMAKKYYGASFLGANIDIDDSDPHGAAFIVTCPVVKTK